MAASRSTSACSRWASDLRSASSRCRASSRRRRSSNRSEVPRYSWIRRASRAARLVEVADGDRPGHRVVAAESSSGSAPPWACTLYTRPQPAGQRLLLAGPLPLEPAGSRRGAPITSACAFLIRASSRAISRCLSARRCSTCSSSASSEVSRARASAALRSLLLELLLGLAQLALLGLDRVLGLLRGGRLGAADGRRASRRPATRAASRRADALTRSGRPRASQPPEPAEQRPGEHQGDDVERAQERRAAATPSVSVTSGSRRGPRSA